MLHGPREDLIRRLGAPARALDVGCWSGYAGRQLLAQGAGRVDGVEPEAAMAARALHAGYTHVWAEPLEATLPSMPGPYDAILALDVVEHLADPWAALRALTARLSPSGLLAISVPNVAHWSVRQRLLRGRFDYTRFGIMDATHLRFFTAATLTGAVRDAGLDIEFRGQTWAPLPVIGDGRLARSLAARRPGLFAVQFVWLCRRTAG